MHEACGRRFAPIPAARRSSFRACGLASRRHAKRQRRSSVPLTLGAAAVTAAMIEWIKGAVFDGTLFRDDEMIALVRACGSTSGKSSA